MFLQKCIWPNSFFAHGQLFSFNGRLSLSVKFCSSQKFMIGYNIYIIQYLWIYQIHIVSSYTMFLSAILLVKQMQKSQLLGKYLAGSNFSPKTTS